MPVAGSNTERRTRPESTTIRTPSMVRLVSAMLVASTTLRVPGATLAQAPHPDRRLPGRQRAVTTRTSGVKASAIREMRCTRRISRAPGRKTRTSPVSSVSAVARATRRGARESCAGPEPRRPESGGAPRPAVARLRLGTAVPRVAMTGASQQRGRCARRRAWPTSRVILRSRGQIGARIEQQRKTQIRLQAALMEFVEDDERPCPRVPDRSAACASARLR